MARCESGGNSLLSSSPRPEAPSLRFHSVEASIVVGKLLEMRPRNLARKERIAAGHVCLRVVTAVLHLNC